MRLRAAIQGDLKKMMAQEIKDATAGMTQAVQEVGEETKQRLRQQVEGAGLGKGIAKGWRGKYYPNQEENPAYLVYTKARKIVRAFSEGVVVRPRKSRFLAIPTPEARQLAGRRGRGAGGRYQKLSPATWPASIPLRFVARPRPPHLLVLDDVAVTRAGRVVRGSRTKTGRLKRGAATVVAFFLYPQVRLPKKLDVDGVFDWADRELIPRIQRYYQTTPVSKG